MTSLDPLVRDHSRMPPATAPYAQPEPGGFGALVSRDGVMSAGPYIPVVARGMPSLPSSQVMMRDAVPAAVSTIVRSAPQGVRAITPLYVPPIPPGPDAYNHDKAPPASVPALPWIDSFLLTTPALPMTPIEEPTAPPGAWSPELAAPLPSDIWALNDAVHQLRKLADGLTVPDRVAPNGPVPSRPPTTRVAPDGLARWRDGDLIHPTADGLPPTGKAGAEAAARALELLAGRVRDGEISLDGYEPRLGDAAVLAAALAALLGVRR
jgi:hypothetical protein